MKKTTQRGVYLIMTLFCATTFAQITGTGTLSNSNEPNQGIQNKSAASGNNLTSVLILGSPGVATWIDDVESQLDNTGLVDAETFLIDNATPTLAQVSTFDAVFVFTDAAAADPVALGDILATYIEAGGAVVDATFTPNVPITGGFTAFELYSVAGQSNGTNLGIGTINVPNHATLSGVNSFDGGTASFHNTAGTLAAGAIIVAEYTTGAPLVIVQENVGSSAVRRVFLNFYPPSIDVRDDFWNVTSDGALLMANALTWAAGVANDLCDDALPVDCDTTVVGSTLNASDTGGSASPDVFYTFTGSGGPEDVTLSLCDGDTGYDSRLRVFDDGCALVNEIAENDDDCGLQSQLTFVSDGTTTYTIMVEGFDGDDSGDFSLAISCETILSVNDNVLEGFSAYPNPAGDVLNITARTIVEHVTVFNVLGQKVMDQNIDATDATLNVSEIASGMYLMQVTIDGNQGTYRFIKE